MAVLSDAHESLIRDYLQPVELSPVSKPSSPVQRHGRDGAVKSTLLVAGKTFEDGEETMVMTARHQSVANMPNNLEHVVSRRIDAPTPPKAERGSLGGQMPRGRGARQRRPGRRLLKPTDVVIEEGIQALRLRTSQAARDLNLVRSGKVRTLHLTMLPPKEDSGGLAIDASAGASSLYQAMALSLHSTRSPRGTNPRNSSKTMQPSAALRHVPSYTAQAKNTSAASMLQSGNASAFRLFETAATEAIDTSKPVELSPLKQSWGRWNHLHRGLSAVGLSEAGLNHAVGLGLPDREESPLPQAEYPRADGTKRTPIAKQSAATHANSLLTKKGTGSFLSVVQSLVNGARQHGADTVAAGAPSASLPNSNVAMSTLNSRLGGGPDAVIPDLVSLQLELDAESFALSTFSNLRDGGIGVDLGFLALNSSTSIDELRRKGAAVDAALTSNGPSVATYPRAASNSPERSSAVPAPIATNVGTLFLPTLKAQESQMPSPPSSSASARASVFIDPRLHLYLRTPEPPPYLSYTSRREETEPVSWPSFSSVKKQLNEDFIAKLAKGKHFSPWNVTLYRQSGNQLCAATLGFRGRVQEGGAIHRSQSMRKMEDAGKYVVKGLGKDALRSPAHTEFLRFLNEPILERGAGSTTTHGELHVQSPKGGMKARLLSRPLLYVNGPEQASLASPRGSDVSGKRDFSPTHRPSQTHRTDILSHFPDLGTLAPKLTGMSLEQVAQCGDADKSLGIGDIYDLTRLAHDRELASRLRSMDTDRQLTLQLKTAILDSVLENLSLQQVDVPEDDIHFMRFYAEESRVLREKTAAKKYLGWYKSLIMEMARRQADDTIHPAQRFVLHRVQIELREGRGLTPAFMEELLLALAGPDPLHALNAPIGTVRPPLGTGTVPGQHPLGSISTALAIIHAFVDKLRARAARARESAFGRKTSPAAGSQAGDVDDPPAGIRRGSIKPSQGLGTPHSLSAAQLLQLHQNPAEPLLLHNAAVQTMLAFLRRILRMSLFEWDALHSKLGLLPHATPVELIIHKSFCERVKLAKLVSHGSSLSNDVLDTALRAPEGVAPYNGGVLSDMFSAQLKDKKPTKVAKPWRQLLREEKAEQFVEEGTLKQINSPYSTASDIPVTPVVDPDGTPTPSPRRPDVANAPSSTSPALPARIYSFLTDAVAAEVAARAQRSVAEHGLERGEPPVTTALANSAADNECWAASLAAKGIPLAGSGFNDVSKGNLVPIIGHSKGRRLSVGPFSFNVTND